MAHVAYVNGRYLPLAEAGVGVEDRGFQFADGVYEVIAVWNGLPVDYGLHILRLERNLRDLRIAAPMSRGALAAVMRQVIRRNRLRTGTVYVQVTRGEAPRNHPFPQGVPPTLVMTARPGLGPTLEQVAQGVAVVTVPEIRWLQRDIKAVGLLPNVLAKQAARERGAFEAWMVQPDDGVVTEGSSTNAWMVDGDGRLITHPLGKVVLPGITRQVLCAIAARENIPLVERPFTVDELMVAREAFLTSTTALLLPVVAVDGATIANGVPGSLSLRLRSLLEGHMYATAAATAWDIPEAGGGA